MIIFSIDYILIFQNDIKQMRLYTVDDFSALMFSNMLIIDESLQNDDDYGCSEE